MFRARIVASVMAIVVCIPAVLLSSPVTRVSAAVASRIIKQNGFNGEVKSISEPDTEGTRYLGGRFSAFNAWDTGPGVVVNSTSADVNVTFPKIAGSYSTIKAVVSDGLGGFYIGGTFTSVDGQAWSNAAHINPDGSLDTAWNPAPNNTVNTLVVSGSTVYLGGSFTQVKATTRNRAAAVDATNAALVTGWDPAPNNTVNTLVVSGSTVYLGGAFTQVKSTTRNYAAAVDATNAALVTGWDPAPNGQVNTLVVSGSTVYMGGSFATVKATARNNAAAVDAASSALATWDPNLDGTVYSLAVSGSTVYIGGYFWYINAYATSRNRAAAVSATTGIATSWNPSPSGLVNTLVVSGSTVYMGGSFTTVNNTTSRINAAAVEVTSGIASSWNPSPRGTVNALSVWGTRSYLGGDFQTVGGSGRNNAAAIDSSGGLTSWNPDVNGYLTSVFVKNSNVYFCGSFSTVGGISKHDAAIVGTNGVLQAFSPMSHSGSYVDIVPYGNYVYIATSNLSQNTYSNPGPGRFTGRNEVVSSGKGITKYDATFNAQGTNNEGYVAWPYSVGNLSFSSYTYSVSKLLLQGTTMYLVGNFGLTNGTGRRSVAAFDVTTDTLLDWAPLANDQVSSIGISGNTVYLGGNFTAIGGTYTNYYKPGSAGAIYDYVAGGTSRNNLAAVDVTTGSLSSWNPNMSGSSFAWVTAIASSGSSIFVGGYFDHVGGNAGTLRNRLAAFDASTGNLLSWNPNAQGTSGTTSSFTNVSGLAISGSNVLMGGNFSSINGSSRFGYAVVDGSTNAVIDSAIPNPPVNSVLPVLSGTAEIGQTLSASTGTWSGSPTSYSYEWMWSSTASGSYAPIANATSNSYSVSDTDAGRYIKVIVTASNVGGSAAALSSATSMVPIPAPRNLTVPVVAGSATVGNLLSASSTGTWANSPTSYLYQWQRSTSVSGTYADISAATTSSYTLLVGDIGYYIRLSVIARSGVGDSIGATSIATSQVVDLLPTNSVIPVVTGTAQTGQSLSVSSGTWNNRETSYSYQWARSTTLGGSYVSIASATAATYVVASTDVGYFIKGTVAGVNSGGTAAYASSTATAQVIDIAPVYTGPPVITGTAQIGQTLSVSNGSWDNRPISYRYQWKRASASDGTYANISGATGNTYQVSVDDLGWFFKAVVTGVNTGGDAGTSAWSAATAASIDLLPVNTAIPVAIGTAQTGQTLIVSTGSWDNRPTSYRYQWKRSATVGGSYVDISGANVNSYVVAAGDVGYFIKGTVAGVNTGGTATSVLSVATDQVIDIAPLYVSAPAITGTAQTGQTLSVSNGTWSNRPTSYVYQWRRSLLSGSGYADIVGANINTYVVGTNDVGYFITAVVSSSNSGGNGDQAGTAAASAIVIDIAPTNAVIPLVSGTAQTGQALSVSTGSWNNRALSFVYQWKRSATSGGVYLDIVGANLSTYAVAAGDVGYFIKGTVAGVNTGGTAAYEASVATAQVIDIAPTNAVIPLVSGTAQTGQALSVSTGSWNNRALSFVYQWKRSATSGGVYLDIVGANLSTYAVAAGDVGYFIKGTVAGVNTGGTAAYEASVATAQVIDITPLNATPPSITGVSQLDQTLSVSNGSWNNRPTSFTYQWQRASTASGAYLNIDGATRSTYVVSVSDLGLFIKAVVTATNTGGDSVSPATSAATAVVIDITPTISVLPVVSGTAQTGQTLSVSTGTWNNRAVSYQYQWKRASTANGSYVDITNAMSATYVVDAGDVGYFIKGTVAAVNTGGTSTYALSIATAQTIDIPPVYSGPPAITGTAQTGQTLSASTGSWSNRATSYTYQWKRALTVGGVYSNVADATASTYVIAYDNVGYYMKVEVIGVNSGGVAAASAWSAATAAVIDIAPVSSSVPTISGTAQTGQTLTVSSETWTNRPTSYAYQWKRASSLGGSYSIILGAISATYSVVAGDVGYYIKASTTASNTGGSSVAVDSVATTQTIDIAPVNATSPAITGTAQTGQTLTVSNGNWDNRATSYTYQWKRSASSNGSYVDISGAINATYVVTAGDVGYFVRAVVAGVNPGGSSSGAVSAATAIVIDLTPTIASASVITGTAQNGQTLSASNGTWNNRPLSFTYQWKRSTTVSGTYSDIVGAASSTVVLAEGDVGYFYKVVVTASNSGGTSASSTSAATSAVLDIAPVNTGAPSITGTAQVNETLSASRGTWASSPTAYTYQWKRASSASGSYSNIDGETSGSYSVTSDDVGKFIKVAVTATNSIGASNPMLSAAKGPAIDVIAINAIAPTVSGTARNAETLTANTGTWDNRPTSYAYQWKRASTATGTYVAIAGETDRTYVLNDNDVDKFIKVLVTAVNSGGSSVAVSSTTAIGPIDDLPSMTAPTVSDVSVTRTATGFTFQVSNYSSTTTYSLTATAGSVTLGETGLATVTGLSAGSSATVTVRVSRTGYRSASVIVVGSTLTPATTSTIPATTTIAPVAGQVTTTTVKLAPNPRLNVPTTTIAVAKSVSQTQVSTPPKTTTTVPNTTTTTVPALEAAAPGAANATVDGEVVEAEVTRVDNKVVASSGGVTATVGVLNADGSTSALDTDGNVRVKPGQLFNLAVDGFIAGSTVAVWLFSTPHKLGDLITAADGTVTATFAIPSDLKGGKHRLAFVGKGVGGKKTTLVVGIVAGAEPKNWSSTKILIVFPLVLAIFAALLLPGALRRRRKRLA
ncbi:MAG: beta strand repeat-containing protein [Ilumatobacteraceae bacterium]